MTGLPFAAQAFMAPEDLLLGILRPLEDDIPGLKVRSTIEPGLTTPYMLCRAYPGAWNSDSFGSTDRRFIRRFLVDVQVWTEDPDGDDKGAMLSELAYQQLFAASRTQLLIPGIGSISSVRASSPPHRAADWATATGVNQFANLSKNMHRYQATYGIAMRPDRRNPLSREVLIAAFS